MTRVTSRELFGRTAMFSTYVPFGNWWIVWPFAGGAVVMLRAKARVRKYARERGCIAKRCKQTEQSLIRHAKSRLTDEVKTSSYKPVQLILLRWFDLSGVNLRLTADVNRDHHCLLHRQSYSVPPTPLNFCIPAN